ncbi:MAG: hypothetical protein ACP5OA_02215 [Candidatus Woesearchaeota archaeon]
MKSIPAIIALMILIVAISPNIVFADIGPKPSADIHVTLNGEDIPDMTFSAKMMTCNYEMKYEQIISELSIYEESYDWYSKCQETAPKYGLDAEICYGDLQHQRGMTNVSKQARCDNEMCNKLTQKIPDVDRGCYWTIAPLAWGGNCQDSNCNFNYFLPSKFRLEIYLPSQDRIYLSDEVNRLNFKSSFEAELNPDGSIDLQETTPFIQSNSAKNIRNFIIALIVTLTLELIVALIYISITKIPKKIIISVIIANIISLPVVWFIFPLLKDTFLVILLGELFAFVFEGYCIHFLNKETLPLKKSFILSTVMNFISLIIGGGFILFLTKIFYL